jgi:hypothetical protein
MIFHFHDWAYTSPTRRVCTKCKLKQMYVSYSNLFNINKSGWYNILDTKGLGSLTATGEDKT